MQIEFKTLQGINNMKKERTNAGKARRIISVILAVIGIVCVILLILHAVHQKKEEAVYEVMRENAVAAENAAPEDKEATDSRKGDAAVTYADLPDVDFDALWETNTDICAWIRVPGTQVDYPVLRREEAVNPYDDYYLQHTVEGTDGLPGAIYMEPCNAADFCNGNTVLYGHNMKNGTMFGSLHEFEKDAFFNEWEYVYVAAPEKTFVYRIYAAVTYSNLHIMGNYDFTAAEGLESFVDSLEQNRDMADLFRESARPAAGDRLLTLSTCVKGEDDKRFLVVAVLTDEVLTDEN